MKAKRDRTNLHAIYDDVILKSECLPHPDVPKFPANVSLKDLVAGSNIFSYIWVTEFEFFIQIHIFRYPIIN